MDISNKKIEKNFLKAYDEFSDAIFRYCLFKVSDRDVAKDITQDTFKKTWEYIISGKEIRDTKPFLYRVANNLIIDLYRKRKEDFSLDKMREEGFDVQSRDNIEMESDIHCILEEISKLGDNCKSSLIMRFVEDMRVKDIADILNLSENTLSVRLKRCIRKLSESIKYEI
jgi:RNA polymerase sigma-70 factor (ECF subfamily)